MKESYPFLAYWSKIGRNKFPKLIDDPEIFNSFVITHFDRYPEVFKEPSLIAFRKHSLFYQFAKPENKKLMEQEAWERIRPDLVPAYYDSIKRMCEKHNQKDLDLILEARSNIMYEGRTVTDNAEQLGRSLLSKYHGKGGKIFKTKLHLEIIKLMYEEMRHAITEIRQAVQVPCTIRNSDTWAYDDETVQILESVPDCKEIFNRKELSSITAMSSVADCAILIIKKRLKSYFLPQSPGTNSIKRQLQKK